MVDDDEIRFRQALRQLAEIPLAHERLSGVSKAVLFRVEPEFCRLRGRDVLTCGGRCGIRDCARLFAGFVDGGGRRASLFGDDGLGLDLCRLDGVIGGGRSRRRMNRFDQNRQQFDSAAEMIQIRLHGASNVLREGVALLPQQSIQRS